MSKRPAPTTSSGNIPALSIPAKARLTRELSLLNSDPPPGVAAYLPCSSDMSKIHAQITGPESSPFETGVFFITVNITPRYPFEPPRCRFVTPIFHPNVDSAGRICLDTLKTRPAGSWSPAVSLPSLLLSIRSLMSEPNPDDGLVPEISDLYKRNPARWREEAKKRTLRDATPEKISEMEKKVEGRPPTKEDEEIPRARPQDPPPAKDGDETIGGSKGKSGKLSLSSGQNKSKKKDYGENSESNKKSKTDC